MFTPAASGIHKWFVYLMQGLGLAVLMSGLANWQVTDPIRWGFLLLVALIASGVKVNLPQIPGALTINFVFVLMGLLEFSLAESLTLGALTNAVNVWVHRDAQKLPAPRTFPVAANIVATALAWHVYHAPWLAREGQGILIAITLASTTLFALNTLPLAIVVGLAQRTSVARIWSECNFKVFPLYLAGGLIAALFHFSGNAVGAQSILLLLPIAFIIYCSYHAYTGRIGEQKKHVEQMASLHERTIEALAMAIEAKDMTPHTHVKRLYLYCVEIGKELALPENEMEALKAAAVMHDIGKLAVPEHILSKPGKLTREEFEKVKIHPTVGAEILERVNFPYPVARIVRYHHEKWNGGGYPHGLKGQEIPIGARILAAVDCLDALISDRPYRTALPLEVALNRLLAESGASFDPTVIRLIRSKYAELEERLARQESEPARPPYERDVAAEMVFSERGPAPPLSLPTVKPAFLDKIAAARQEAQVLLELTQELGKSLHLDETLSMISTGMRRIVQFDSIVIYIVEDNMLRPRYASGECTSLFLSRQIPIGQGIAGWVSAHGKPVLNGNPSLEAGSAPGSTRAPILNSAVAVPLIGLQGGPCGVLMACRRNLDAFTKDDLRILLAVSAKLGSVAENALRYEQATASASTDFLTGLPNARALQLQLDAELARCRRLGGSLTVLVTDLDGFKEVNDRFGHMEGNTVLRAVGKALRESCREYDFVARMGGDEFVILLPGLEQSDVLLKVTQLNQAVRDASKSAIADCLVSLSVGQARYPNDGDDPERLLSEADQRMYQVKTNRKLRKAGQRGFDFDVAETTSSQPITFQG